MKNTSFANNKLLYSYSSNTDVSDTVRHAMYTT